MSQDNHLDLDRGITGLLQQDLLVLVRQIIDTQSARDAVDRSSAPSTSWPLGDHSGAPSELLKMLGKEISALPEFWTIESATHGDRAVDRVQGGYSPALHPSLQIHSGVLSPMHAVDAWGNSPDAADAHVAQARGGLVPTPEHSPETSVTGRHASFGNDGFMRESSPGQSGRSGTVEDHGVIRHGGPGANGIQLGQHGAGTAAPAHQVSEQPGTRSSGDLPAGNTVSHAGVGHQPGPTSVNAETGLDGMPQSPDHGSAQTKTDTRSEATVRSELDSGAQSEAQSPTSVGATSAAGPTNPVGVAQTANSVGAVTMPTAQAGLSVRPDGPAEGSILGNAATIAAAASTDGLQKLSDAPLSFDASSPQQAPSAASPYPGMQPTSASEGVTSDEHMPPQSSRTGYAGNVRSPGVAPQAPATRMSSVQSNALRPVLPTSNANVPGASLTEKHAIVTPVAPRPSSALGQPQGITTVDLGGRNVPTAVDPQPSTQTQHSLGSAAAGSPHVPTPTPPYGAAGAGTPKSVAMAVLSGPLARTVSQGPDSASHASTVLDHSSLGHDPTQVIAVQPPGALSSHPVFHHQGGSELGSLWSAPPPISHHH